jgi:NADPH2:quinone reductase
MDAVTSRPAAVPATRRAVVLDRFGPPEVMRVANEPMPEPGEHEVLVAVEAIGVNFADTIVRRGEYRREQPLSFTPGFEVAGRVTRAGSGAALAPGTPVVAFTENGRGYADYVVVPAGRVYPVPGDVAAEDLAALFIQGVTAWYAVHRYGRVADGERVLVHAGAGGVGGLAIQLARRAGAIVVATASSEEKLEIARELGAHAGVRSDPETLRADVQEVTGGRGCEVVIDGVGGPLFAPSLALLANSGRYVVVGSASQEAAELDVRRLMPRAQTVVGFIVARVADEDPEEPRAALLILCDLLRAGHLRLRRTLVPFEDVARVHEDMEARRHTGKYVLVTGAERTP